MVSGACLGAFVGLIWTVAASKRIKTDDGGVLLGVIFAMMLMFGLLGAGLGGCVAGK